MSAAPVEESPPTTPRLRAKRPDSSAHPLAKIVPDRRRFRRVAVNLSGRFMRENREEYPCEVVQMSAGGMILRAPVSCPTGERIVAYLDHVGRVEGVVVRQIDDGIAVRILASASKRERIVNLLTWLINQRVLGLSDERKYERVVPRITASKLIMPNGDVHNCRVLDV